MTALVNACSSQEHVDWGQRAAWIHERHMLTTERLCRGQIARSDSVRTRGTGHQSACDSDEQVHMDAMHRQRSGMLSSEHNA